jgi:hypothetical protein
MTLAGVEFVRRFLLHVLPTGFVRIRYFGLFANRVRAENLARCRALLGVAPCVAASPAPCAPSTSGDSEEDRHRCPSCATGRLRWMALIPRPDASTLDATAPTLMPVPRDTS